MGATLHKNIVPKIAGGPQDDSVAVRATVRTTIATTITM